MRTMGLLSIFSSIKARAEKFLNEKNVVTDFLGTLEEKTGVKKKIIAAGTLVRFLHWFFFLYCLNVSVGVVKNVCFCVVTCIRTGFT